MKNNKTDVSGIVEPSLFFYRNEILKLIEVVRGKRKHGFHTIDEEHIIRVYRELMRIVYLYKKYPIKIKYLTKDQIKEDRYEDIFVFPDKIIRRKVVDKIEPKEITTNN
jgi:hypothetical protein